MNPCDNLGSSESDEARAKWSGAVAGECVTETFKYDGERQVTVYVPPKTPEAIVFAGDGQGIPRWARVLEKAGVDFDDDGGRASVDRRDAADP